MKFRTEFEVLKSELTLDPSKPVVMVGSCFTQNMAAKMNSHLWKAVDPCGTLYNPFSLAFAIEMMLGKDNGIEEFEKSLFEFNGIWNSNFFDSSFSSGIKEDCVEEFRLRQNEFINALNQGQTLIATFGTSICYHLQSNGMTVGNCHKRPSNLFFEKRMKIKDIVDCWNIVIDKLRNLYPEIKIIFTVSPVRHLKNGFSGNSRSKAVLQIAIEEICGFNDNCVYFPAYEIMTDDLRDYRFYASDLVHPSQEAIDYIWEKFRLTFMDENGNKILEEGYKKMKAALHRPKTGALGKPLCQQSRLG